MLYSLEDQPLGSDFDLYYSLFILKYLKHKQIYFHGYLQHHIHTHPLLSLEPMTTAFTLFLHEKDMFFGLKLIDTRKYVCYFKSYIYMSLVSHCVWQIYGCFSMYVYCTLFSVLKHKLAVGQIIVVYWWRHWAVWLISHWIQGFKKFLRLW